MGSFLNLVTKKLKYKGGIISEYCNIIPYQNKNSELNLSHCIQNHYVIENICVYNLYSNNETGRLEQYHIFV